MDAATLALAIDLVGWSLWAILTRRLAREGAGNQWITVDYYISTLLLILSTVCTVAGAFLTDPILVTRIAVPLGIVALGVLALRNLRSTARAVRTVRMQYTSDTGGGARPAPAPAPPQWETITAPDLAPARKARRPAPTPPRAGGIFNDPLIQEIESRRMTA